VRHRYLALGRPVHFYRSRLRAVLERDGTLDLEGGAPATPGLRGRVPLVGLGILLADAHARQPDGALPVQLVDLDVAVVALVRFHVVVHLVVFVLVLVDVGIAVMRHGAGEKLRQVDLDPGEVEVRERRKAGNGRQADVQVAIEAMPLGRLFRVVLRPRLREGRGRRKTNDGDEHGTDHGFASSDSCTTSRSERRYPAYPSSTRMRTFTSSVATARDSPSCAR